MSYHGVKGPVATPMQAVVLAEFGPPDVLTLAMLPRPEPGPGEVRVRVRASFVAFGRDVSLRNGKHPIFPRLVSLPHVLGGEHAGLIDAVGQGVDASLVGRRVAVSAPVACGRCENCQRHEPWDCTARQTLGIQRKGSNAEYTVVPTDNVQDLPAGLSFEHAAAYAASGPLAWAELDAGGLRAGECLFVPGASGSVGMLLISLARRRGAHIIAATRGRRAAGHLLALGAHAVVDSSDPDLAATLRKASPHGGVDVVVDNVADVQMWQRYWPAVARRGRIVVAGQAGNTGEPLPINVVEFYNRQATLSGLTLGDPRPVAAFWAMLRDQPLVIADDLVEAFPLARAADAHRRIESGGKVGHVVLSVS